MATRLTLDIEERRHSSDLCCDGQAGVPPLSANFGKVGKVNNDFSLEMKRMDILHDTRTWRRAFVKLILIEAPIHGRTQNKSTCS